MSNPADDSFDNSSPAAASVAAAAGRDRLPPFGAGGAGGAGGAAGAGGAGGAFAARGASAHLRAWIAALGACLPQHCALCAAPSGTLLVCPDCDRTLPTLPPACPRCALPAPLGAVCGPCTARAPPFACTIAAFAYAFPLDRILQSFKYSGQLALAGYFAEALTRHVRRWPDALVALPLSPHRQRQRGYNQAGEIARALARRGRVPLLDALARTRNTPPQADLAWADRFRNVRGAFAARPTVAGLRIAIVDDVMTTGATLRAAAIALRNAGAREVEAWVVARTLPTAQSP